MDPNETLRRIRALAVKIINGDNDPNDARELAELVEALDKWIARGGFLPNAWKN